MTTARNTPNYHPIAYNEASTVVAEYLPEPRTARAHQSEAELEREVIELLQSQAYEYLPITTEAELITNLRTQLEKLNKITFSENEWQQFFTNTIVGKNDGIVEKTRRIQEKDSRQELKRDDGSTKNIMLLDKEQIHNNRLQVINQYDTASATNTRQANAAAPKANRYDMTILVNGLPLVHIELKRRGVDIREAFNQIQRYQRDSFWAGSGLFEYVHLFVISNGTHTKYYSNTTRNQHLTETRRRNRKQQTSHSFEFTSWWADAKNTPIQDIVPFVKTFFAKHTLLSMLTRYCVFTENDLLLVMRPYQIVATERIIQRITTATNHKQLGTLAAGGYVWHTTGSGKTLTSFKTAQIAAKMPSVAKVLFVVDRKDLDYQTMREYERFQKGAANSNTSTARLKEQLENKEARIIITTIQKLSTFVTSQPQHPVYQQHVVIIFDECHRSQFGDMHTRITRAFKRYNLFGFTGTPIFEANSGNTKRPQLQTTEQAFGDKLHTYTIVDAITDKNVLPFRIDYINTVKVGNVIDKQVAAIASEQALLDPRRIGANVRYTLEHFDQKTKRSSAYQHRVVTNVSASVRKRDPEAALAAPRVLRGFNALFATASIDAARQYYNEFQRQQQDRAADQRLKIAVIYSTGTNETGVDGQLDDESFDTCGLTLDAREFLDEAISDYNELFQTNYDTSADSFHNYYKELSQRLKNRELDLVIVVNMFLTGFDATTLNTLFVDKNLRAHGLIQAYSRTNRILNSVKTYGNIVTFRDLEEATNQALELFGNKHAHGVVLMQPYGDYYREYAAQVATLCAEFPPGQTIIGETAQKKFVTLFSSILRLNNILTSFDEFTGNDPLPQQVRADYQSNYLALHAELRRNRNAEKEPINDDLVFEIELIKQVEINVDYILLLVENYREHSDDQRRTEIRANILRSVAASPTLRNKKDLIEAFVDTVSVTDTHAIDEQWRTFIERRREEELTSLIREEDLPAEAARAFVAAAFRDGQLRTTGTDITAVLPPMQRFTEDSNHSERKQRVIAKLQLFFERFFGLSTMILP